MASNSQHHQYSYLEDELQFPQELICTVCHDVAGRHTACPGCSQTFCQNCVHKWFDTQKSNAQGCTCPYCRRRLKFSDLKHDPKIQQQLDDLQVNGSYSLPECLRAAGLDHCVVCTVHCPNQNAGCTAVVARGSMPAHLKRDCWAQQCSCKFCGLQGLRKDISQHESCECLQRLIPCSNAAAGCSALVPVSLLQEHLEHSCPATQRPCPHCQQQVQRSSWALHLQCSCPASRPCPLRLYGCSYSGSAADVLQHSQCCEYQQQRQQLERELADGDGRAAAAAAAARLSGADVAELPSSAVVDSYEVFGAPSVGRAAAHACGLLLQAIPEAALPPKLQQDAEWLVTKASAAATSSRPAALAAQTAPYQFTLHASSSSEAEVAAAGASSSCSMSLAESLALGRPECFTTIGLQSEPLLECCWRVLLNLNMFDILSADYADIQLPSCFLLYTSLIRAWEAVQRILGPRWQQQEHERQQQQQERQRGRRSSTDSGGSAEREEHLLPGVQRGLDEDEADDLSYWLYHQRQLLQAAASAIAPFTQLWLGLGWPAFAPDQAVELGELLQMGQGALQIVAEVVVASSSNHGSNSSGGSRRDGSSGGGAGRGGPGLAPGDQAMHEVYQDLQRAGMDGDRQQPQHQQQATPQRRQGGWLNRLVGVLGAPAGEQQQQAGGAGAAVAAAAAAPRGLGGQGLGVTGARGRQQAQGQRQQQQGAASSRAAAAATAGTAAGDPAMAARLMAPSFSVALQQLQRLASGPPLPAKRRTPKLLQGLAPLEALELTTAVLLLSSARAMHVETMQIPTLPPMMMASYRLFWGPSVLAGCGVWLGQGVQLGWQAVAVLSDMLMEVANRFMQALGEGFYDPDEMRVPLTPRMTMAAARLVLPAGLLGSCLQRVVGLSRAFHDEECEDLSEVTWSEVAARIGLELELDKLVALVEERLPVSFEDEDEDEDDMDEDEDEDDEEDESEQEEGSGSDSDYTTDDEYMQEQQHEQEQQQQLLPTTTSNSGLRSGLVAQAARMLRDVASAATTGAPPPPPPAAAAAAAAAGPSSSSRRASAGAAAGGSRAPGGASSSSSRAASSSAAAAGRRWSGAASDSGSDGGWESADSDEAAAVLAGDYAQQLQLHPMQQSGSPPVQPAGWSATAAAGGGGAVSQQTPRQAAAGPEEDMQEAQQQKPHKQHKATAAPKAAAAAAGAASAEAEGWHQQLAANLQQLAAASAGLPQLEQHLIQSAMQSVAPLLPVPVSVQDGSGEAGGGAAAPGASSQQGEPSPQQQQQQQQEQQQQQQQQQQEQQSAPDSAQEAGDATTHGVVLIAGFLEVVLKLLLEAACNAAQQQQQQRGAGVLVTARHVLLGAAGCADLSSLLLHRSGKPGSPDSAAVAWAGAAPCISSLLPAADEEPLTAWLLTVAAGGWQQPQQRESTGSAPPDSNTSSSSTRVLFPADFRFYCSAAQPAGSRDVCCFLSGMQCSSCAAATAALPLELDARLDVCNVGLAGLAVRKGAAAAAGSLMCQQDSSNRSSSTGAAEQLIELTGEQLQQLMHATRLYHLQQQWWYEHGAAVNSCSAEGSSVGLGGSSSVEAVAGWRSLPAVDQVQLANLQPLLQPLRDVVALREMHLQQAQGSCVLPMAHFEGMVHDALEHVCAERRQQQRMVQRMQQLGAGQSSRSAGSAVSAGVQRASVASAGAADDEAASGLASEDDSEDLMDLDIEPEALDLLAAAAEDFLVQQLGAAGDLAVTAAGRQEVGAADLRMALAARGHGHLLTQLQSMLQRDGQA